MHVCICMYTCILYTERSLRFSFSLCRSCCSSGGALLQLCCSSVAALDELFCSSDTFEVFKALKAQLAQMTALMATTLAPTASTSNSPDSAARRRVRANKNGKTTAQGRHPVS